MAPVITFADTVIVLFVFMVVLECGGGASKTKRTNGGKRAKGQTEGHPLSWRMTSGFHQGVNEHKLPQAVPELD